MCFGGSVDRISTRLNMGVDEGIKDNSWVLIFSLSKLDANH